MRLCYRRNGRAQLPCFEADGKDKREGVFGQRKLRRGRECCAVGGVDELQCEVAVHLYTVRVLLGRSGRDAHCPYLCWCSDV